jgi:hypothetical protein
MPFVNLFCSIQIGLKRRLFTGLIGRTIRAHRNGTSSIFLVVSGRSLSYNTHRFLDIQMSMLYSVVSLLANTLH